MATIILKGALVAGTLSDNTIGNAHFVRIVATTGSNTITVKDGSTVLGTTLLHTAGDEITIDANADILSLNISDDEMRKRLENWKNPNSSPKSGVLAKYKKTVQSASNGAITD